MLDKISDEALQQFFESKTHLKSANLIRVGGNATIMLEDCNRNHYVTFKITDTSCTASPRERLGNMPTLWTAFLAEQAKTIADSITTANI